MIELIHQYIDSETSTVNKINKLRELLQLLSLKILQDNGHFSNIAFVGGTALRVLYDIRRFSEDMDFSVIDKKGYDFLKIISELKRQFNLHGINLETKSEVKKTVQSSMLKFPRLLNILGISGFKKQKLSIKLKVDSRPPAGWQIEDTLVNKIYFLNITHFALPSLYATKIHACFFRKYAKGRDFYDFLWYLGKKIKPNYRLLNNAIMQTEGKDLALSDKNIADFLREKVSRINFDVIRKDVERFLEDKDELRLLDATVILKSITDVFER